MEVDWGDVLELLVGLCFLAFGGLGWDVGSEGSLGMDVDLLVILEVGGAGRVRIGMRSRQKHFRGGVG